MTIKDVTALQIYDSRGRATVEARVTLAGGSTGDGLVPSGASCGAYEAVAVPADQAVGNIVGEIAPAIVGRDAADQRAIDDALIALDGTPDKHRLGANAILAVSLAAARAAAAERGKPLFAHLGTGTLIPLPEVQLVGGGAHASWRTDVQDYMIVPVGAATYAEGLAMIARVYRAGAEILAKRGKLLGVADEGGFWPDFDSHDAIFEFIHEAIAAAGLSAGRDIALSLDFAATELYVGGRYRFRSENREYSRAELVRRIADWCDRWNVVSIEDPMGEDDDEGWRMVMESLGGRIQVIGDDLFTTNVGRIRRGIDGRLANSVLIKLNQIGTVSETLDAIEMTQQAGWRPVVSARSGETEDAFISHLAVATDAGQLKVGSFTRSERMVKWNELLRIERDLGDRARYAGVTDPLPLPSPSRQ